MSRTHSSNLSRHLLPAIAAAGLFAAASAEAQSWPNVIYHEQKARAAKAMPANRTRVEAEMKAAGLPGGRIAWYAVPTSSASPTPSPRTASSRAKSRHSSRRASSSRPPSSSSPLTTSRT